MPDFVRYLLILNTLREELVQLFSRELMRPAQGHMDTVAELGSSPGRRWSPEPMLFPRTV